MNKPGKGSGQSGMRMNTLFIILMILTTVIVIYNLTDYFYPLGRADRALQWGNYQDAVNLYQQHAGSEKTEKKLNQALLGWAKELVAGGKTEEAKDKLDQISDSGLKAQGYHEIADEMMNRKEYGQAAIMYQAAEDESLYISAMNMDADQKLETGDYAGAIHSLEVIPKTLANQEKLATIWINYADQQMQLVSQYSKENGPDYDYIRNLGNHLTDVNAQLYFCQNLKAKGYSLEEIYPDGVLVTTDLSQYQFVDINENQTIPSLEKVLVFSRDEPIPSLNSYSSSIQVDIDTYNQEIKTKKKEADYGYTVRLHPELMDKAFAENQAGTIQEADTFVLLEKGYIVSGMISLRSSSEQRFLLGNLDLSGTSANLYNNNSYKNYLDYCAYEAITVYNCTEPASGIILESNLHKPVAWNVITGNEFTDAGIKLTESEIQEIRNALKNPDEDESKTILSHYDENTIKFVSSVQEWGDYLLFPVTDEAGKADYLKGTSKNIEKWNIARFMVGVKDDTWLRQKIDEGILEKIKFYAVLLSISEK